jgi:hypothetical protein
LDGLSLEDVGIFFGHLVYFTAAGYILQQFGIFYGRLVYLHQDKSGNPAELNKLSIEFQDFENRDGLTG